MNAVTPSRRGFLTGVGGVLLALPALESLRRTARAAMSDGRPPRYAVFMRQANGVQQALDDEPERFWPRQTGPLDPQVLQYQDADRTISELANHARDLLVVRGTRLPFPSEGCAHSFGAAQLLTGSRPVGAGAAARASGESVDSLIARTFPQNGGQPLTLYTGPRRGDRQEVLSYSGPEELRSAEDDPWTVYARMVGSEAQYLDALLDQRRRSVNDLVREQLDELRRQDLSADDRRRLDRHFDAVRDFEVLSCRMTDDEEAAMADLSGRGQFDANRLEVATWHLDLIALAIACDHIRAATLQIGDGTDQTEYELDGGTLPRFHYVSHRVQSNSATGVPIEGADLMHHRIDREHAKLFRHLLDRLREGELLDSTVAVWGNDLANGPRHSFHPMPWVLAGSAGGVLRTGRFVDVGDRPHSHLLSTLATAVGVCHDDGSPIDDFGDPSLPPGLLDTLLA